MKRLGWKVKLGLVLLTSTAALSLLHYLIFRDAPTLAFYNIQGLSMLPLEVLIVTLLLNSALERQAFEDKMRKIHMVIGAFFGEVGTSLLDQMSELDGSTGFGRHFTVDQTWDGRSYKSAKATAKSYEYTVQADMVALRALDTFLAEKRPFLLGLLQNPNLLEHESFTDALWAVTHLSEELEFRDLSADLPRDDMAHLNGDIARAYSALTLEWLDYVRHLQQAYPYLFSLAVRRNPLTFKA